MTDLAKVFSGGLAIFALVCVVNYQGWASGAKFGEAKTREEAVRAGVAHYESDDQGQPKFVWNSSP